jgi:ABC-type transporter Mla subunit MlaD
MYNGVTIGHVYSIDIAPDGRLVEVLMKVRSDFHMDSTIVATMQLIGITGLQVINLSSDSVSYRPAQRLGFEVDYPVIPVGEGAFQTVTSTLTRITQVLYEVDFKSISDELLLLLENTNSILSSDRIDSLEASLLSNSRRLDSLLAVYTRLGRNLNRMVLRLEDAAPELAEDLDSLIVELHALSEPLGRFADTFEQLLTESSEVLSNLSSLLEILRTDPSELFIRTSGEGVWQ